jgi:membrane dipeptidase
MGAQVGLYTQCMIGSERARALHAAHPPIDLHADTLLWVQALGYDMHTRHGAVLPRAAWGGHVDVPRMVEGGLGGQFLSLVVLPYVHASPWDVLDQQISMLEAVLAKEPGLKRFRTAADLEQCAKDRQIGVALSIEGAQGLSGSLHRFHYFVSRGLRYLGLVHFNANQAACPAYGLGAEPSQGLKPFGRDLVAACEASNVLVDLAHTNRAGFLEACAMASRPLIVSHTGVTGAFRHWRNIDDDQLRAVARTGGVIGVIFVPRFIGERTVSGVVRHIQHVIRVAGEDAVALGSDWDGMVIPTWQLRDPAHLPMLTDALLDHGLSEAQVAKVLRGNVMRVLGA